jgi:ketosteroid isomerase-like protein
VTPGEVAFRFIERINAGDVPGLVALMTEDHEFRDSMGARVAGRPAMAEAWTRYFAMVPDYRIAVDEVFVSGTVVVLLGTASGTLSCDGSLRPEDAWSTPAAFRAHVAAGLVAAWRVYADNEPIRERLAAGGG